MEHLFMQTSANTSVLLRGKRFFLILGLIFLVAGASLIIVHFVIKPDRIFADSIQRTSTADYVSTVFHAEKGDWVEFDLTTSNCSMLRLRINDGRVPWIDDRYDHQAELYGAVYNQTVQINETNDYFVSLENWAQHALDYGARDPIIISDNNTFSGSFGLVRTPAYFPHILLSGEALLLASCGLFLIPALTYFRFKAKRFGITL
jgi:hypothetical protein